MKATSRTVYETERHLLYVACTRARDHLLVTGVKPASSFWRILLGRHRWTFEKRRPISFRGPEPGNRGPGYWGPRARTGSANDLRDELRADIAAEQLQTDRGLKATSSPRWCAGTRSGPCGPRVRCRSERGTRTAPDSCLESAVTHPPTGSNIFQ